MRRHFPFVRAGGCAGPSLPLAAVLTADEGRAVSTSEPLPAVVLPIEDRRSGPTTGGTFNEYSFYDLFYSEEQLLAGEKPQVAPDVFKDKIVVVSATASGTYEVQATPFEQGISGGEVHANIIDGLLRGRRSSAPRLAVTIATVARGCARGGLLGGACWRLAAWPSPRPLVAARWRG